MFGGPHEEQVILLPARSPKEMSLWGAAALDYAVAFGGVVFERDASRVDFARFDHVTLVQPAFWPEDLVLHARQQNPRIEIDQIEAPTPEVLNTVLNVRVYYGWRYGPRTEKDWSYLWPRRLSLIGLHGRSDGEMEAPDYAIAQAARVEAVKITSHATMETVSRLRAVNPNVFLMVRPIAAFEDRRQTRTVTAREFVEWTTPDLARLYDHDQRIRYFEIHNEPNLRLEGFGGGWDDGAEFGRWFLEVVRLFRQRFPNARFGFPGLSPGPASDGLGRKDWRAFLSQAAFAAVQADWIGIHSYWVNEREMFDHGLGFGFVEYRRRFPEQLLFVTEFGNPAQPKAVVAEQYSRYYAQLRRVKGLGGAFAYVVSTSDPAESSRWAWRDEAGNDLGIAAVIGRRRFIG